MSAAVSTPRTRQGACCVAGVDRASERRGFCRSHDRASRLVNGGDYRARVGGSRFLTVDPVPGGSANDYDYCNQDPVNCSDLAGRATITKNLTLRQLWELIYKLQALASGSGIIDLVTAGTSLATDALAATYLYEAAVLEAEAGLLAAAEEVDPHHKLRVRVKFYAIGWGPLKINTFLFKSIPYIYSKS